MHIRRMTATFGRLQNETLELGDGLNIIQAPNESGKSTWCAFLLSMLYGVNSRERDRAGYLSDKNRYAPWSGAAMSGRMEIITQPGALTLTRDTRRAGAPMAEFSAVYTGTGEPVPGLTAANCGETLLGVGREVYARSAFIRQSGLSINQDPELERRITALMTTGQEDTSYIETADALKKQLNRRRHNKTGLLPALETELAELDRRLTEIDALTAQAADARAKADALAGQETALFTELSAWDRWEAHQTRETAQEAADRAREARAAADALRARLASERVPESDEINRLRGAIVNLNTTRKALDKARETRDEALKALLRAEAAAGESPFAGQTAEQARREVEHPPAGTPVYGGAVALGLLGALAGAGLGWALWSAIGPLPGALSGLGLLAAGMLGAWALARTARKKARQAALIKRFGSADPEVIHQLLETYTALCAARDDAQTNANAKSAAADTLYNTYSSNEQAILLAVRRFAPMAFDILTADARLRDCARLRRQLAEAESAARESQMRAELLVSGVSEDAADAARPARPRETVDDDLARTRSALAAARSEADRLTGRLQSAGAPAELTALRAEKDARRAELEREFDAISLALEVLSSANSALQTRFAPALGQRTAERFSRLTGGRYDAVTLDRQLHLSAQPAGDALSRDAGYLSAGALDQLYLAARLAICDLVLPEEDAPPLVLDDALANFDGGRCAAALELLAEETGHRQILLFTCHEREAAFFAGRPDVRILRLTAAESGYTIHL